MTARRLLLPLLSVTALSLLTAGCHGRTPTEPGFDDEPAAVAASSSAVADTEGDSSLKRHGADDPAGDDRGGRGRGTDDGTATAPGRGRGRSPRQPQAPVAAGQFAGAVRAAAGSSLTLASGVRVTVDGRTQWNARGDLRSVAQIASAVAARRPTRVEGRGARQADGSILAASIKAEVD
jgi:hypothetical protein